MNAANLKKWKTKEQTRASELAEQASRKASPMSIKDFYPELRLENPYTTALDGYMPVDCMLPFFRTVVVGIRPHLKTPEDFSRYYGLSPREMLWLHQNGRLQLRVLFPKSLSTIPRFLNPFFYEGLPSTARDEAFCYSLLAGEQGDVKRRFALAVAEGLPDKAIDKLPGPRKRPYWTAEAVFLQLWALGYPEACKMFESAYKQDASAAFDLLEAFRLFLVGPVHYSLEGIHTVASKAPRLPLVTKPKRPILHFDRNVGVALARELPLVFVRADRPDLPRLLETYPDYENARSALLDLQSAIDESPATVEDAVRLVRSTLRVGRRREEHLLLGLRVLAVTGVTAAALPIAGVQGAILALFTSASTEMGGKLLGKVLRPVARYLRRRTTPNHVTLVLDLAEKARQWYASRHA